MAAVKDKMIELIRALPEDTTVEDVIEEFYFMLQVDEGLAELDRGEGIGHEEVEKRISRWLS